VILKNTRLDRVDCMGGKGWGDDSTKLLSCVSPRGTIRLRPTLTNFMPSLALYSDPLGRWWNRTEVDRRYGADVPEIK